MRFMMLMIPEVYQGAEGQNVDADFTPNAEDIAPMMRYNEELAKAGVLISLDGLQPAVKGARVSFQGGKPRVTDGPFPGATDILGGYWMIQVRSKAEAVEWARKCPARQGDVIEVRQVFEMDDFPEDAQKAAENPVVQAQVERMRS